MKEIFDKRFWLLFISMTAVSFFLEYYMVMDNYRKVAEIIPDFPLPSMLDLSLKVASDSISTFLILLCFGLYRMNKKLRASTSN